MDKGRLFRIICGVMIAIIVGILVILFVSDDDTESEFTIDMSKDYSDTANWMEKLSDDVYISQITIPGAHNSASQNVALGYVMRCQDTSIAQQLENGYRYLDFRVAIEETEDGDKLKLVHDFASCHIDGNLFSDFLYFDDAVADVYKFLQKHSTETVIINIKIEDEDYSTADIQKLLLEQVKSNKDYWYTENEIPTLGEARGRIVLGTRFNDEVASDITGLNMIWDEQDNRVPADIPYELYVNSGYRFWVQDRYKYTVEDKYEAVVDGLENCEADETTMFLNFVSTAGDGKVGHPKGYAKALNTLLMEYELKSETSYGVIIVDFGTADLARHIYYSNF
ncbi:phosphatidylinositol-specific phospholipase C domain-containing protein [Butyrivibrio fibrisolvens]|uniref:phosphatidylinositol-specific phospholipase C domain-containing protein n=1 Tax=Pseudobutyrivibrio ruminis TaxID=46206 RepID=UPI00048271E8|nr:phosphatidylinositol-specific phospholipase C domain-containing protein [Pseudobutyrivibrio ruminis]MDC7280206.1 phosphatidylinositol-specific phospholipase C domain-containing protein [Butyrivibrio fibrisolvens]